MGLKGPVTSPNQLGVLLQQARFASGMSQEQLAKKLRVSQSYVSELESGKSSLALLRIFDFMRATGMKLEAEIPETQTAQTTAKPPSSDD